MIQLSNDPFLPGSVTSDGNENCYYNVIPNWQISFCLLERSFHCGFMML